MKKILSLMAFAVTMMIFTACGDDNDWYQPSSERVLEVTSANVTFSPKAQVGTIVIKSAEALAVESNEAWCVATVDGNTVKVDVTWNTAIESRNAVVKVTSGDRMVQVPVHQDGLYLQFEPGKVYSFQAAGNESEIGRAHV